MSASSPALLDASQSPAARLVAVPSSRQNLLSYLDRLASFEADVIADLSAQTVEELIDTRSKAQALTQTGWHIEVAVDAAIWTKESERKQAARGRGNPAFGTTGVMAAVAKRARQIGCTPRTIVKNKQIFNLMEEIIEIEQGVRTNSILQTLPEKQFYVVALWAVDPVEALQTFSAKRIENPKFRPADAERLLTQLNKTIKQATVKALDNAREQAGVQDARKAMLEHLDSARAVIQTQLINACPDSEFAERMYGELLTELEDYQNVLFDEDVEAALTTAWDEGHITEASLVESTGFPIGLVRRILRLMREKNARFVVGGSSK